MSDKVDFGPRVGADPEVFVSSVGSIVPVCGKVGGTKENPVVVPPIRITGRQDHYKGCVGNFAYQEDNVMFEFNIPGCNSLDAFHRCLQGMVAHVETLLATKGLEPVWDSNAHKFKPAELEKFEQAKQIGCMPDNNAYSSDQRFERKPFNAESLGPWRFCGGHIHVQYNFNNVPPFIMAQFLDVVACLPFLTWDKQKERRKFYGQPGIYRDKPYGIEYRTLSNFWLKKEFRNHNLYCMMENIWELARMANSDDRRLNDAYKRIPWHDVRKAISEEDHKLGSELVKNIVDTTGLYINLGLR
jgi:hypothetical protein